MLEALRAALARVRDAIDKQSLLLKIAQRRAQRRHIEAKTYLRKRDRQRELADEARKGGHRRKAARHDKTAGRYEATRAKRSAKAQHLTAVVKRKVGLIHNLEERAQNLSDRIARANQVVFDITGNKVTGGTPEERFRAANLKAAERCRLGQRANFYSQPGAYTANQVFTGEHSGQRSDCSQFATSACRAAGLGDPNGGGFDDGYTGTMRATCPQISEAEMRRRGAGFVVYGGGSGHHVEDYVDADGGDMTIGHGSAPIDPGVIRLFGDSDYTCHAIPDAA